jgi:hypothetical protein
VEDSIGSERAQRFKEEQRGAIALRGHERDLHALEPALKSDFPQTRHHAMLHAAA